MLQGWAPAVDGRTAPASSVCARSLLRCRHHRSSARPQASEGTCSTPPLQPEGLMAPEAAQAHCRHRGPKRSVDSLTRSYFIGIVKAVRKCLKSN